MSVRDTHVHTDLYSPTFSKQHWCVQTKPAHLSNPSGLLQAGAVWHKPECLFLDASRCTDGKNLTLTITVVLPAPAASPACWLLISLTITPCKLQTLCYFAWHSWRNIEEETSLPVPSVCPFSISAEFSLASPGKPIFQIKAERRNLSCFFESSGAWEPEQCFTLGLSVKTLVSLTERL